LRSVESNRSAERPRAPLYESRIDTDFPRATRWGRSVTGRSRVPARPRTRPRTSLFISRAGVSLSPCLRRDFGIGSAAWWRPFRGAPPNRS